MNNFNKYTDSIKQKEQTTKEQYISQLIKTTETIHKNLSATDRKAAKTEIQRLKRENQRTHNAKVEEKLNLLARGPIKSNNLEYTIKNKPEKKTMAHYQVRAPLYLDKQPFCYAPFLKENTDTRKYCRNCRSGFTKKEDKDKHNCHDQNNPTGRYRCSDCAYETYNIRRMWAHNKEGRHKPTPNHGIETQIMSRCNTDPACICNRCNKGFASEKSAGLHKQSCRKNVNPARIRTTKYTCKKCGKATILKSAAQEMQKGNMDWWYPTK